MIKWIAAVTLCWSGDPWLFFIGVWLLMDLLLSD